MKDKNENNAHFKTLLRIAIVGLLIVFSIGFISSSDQSDDKQKGAHVFGYLDAKNLQPFIDNNYNWITMVPYSGQKDVDSPNLIYHRGNRLDIVRRDSIWSHQIEVAHALGFKVFLKPHIWMHNPTKGK